MAVKYHRIALGEQSCVLARVKIPFSKGTRISKKPNDSRLEKRT
jgi:hypothetical protein